MKVRLRDWASLNCISERTVQVHIKENEAELEGHIERKGKQGTWLDEYAQDFLIERIQLPNRKEVYQPTARENALMIQLNEVALKLAAAEQRAAENAGVAALLEASNAEKQALQARNDSLLTQIGSLEAQNAFLSSQNVDLSNDNLDLAGKLKAASEDLKTASEDVKAEQDKNHLLEQTIDRMKKATLWQRIRGWKE